MKYDEIRLFSKLDAMSIKLNSIAETTAKQEQHFADMNGTVARHEKMFKDLYEKTDTNTNEISMAKGGLAGMDMLFKVGGFIVVVLTAISLSKSLGLW